MNILLYLFVGLSMVFVVAYMFLLVLAALDNMGFNATNSVISFIKKIKGLFKK